MDIYSITMNIFCAKEVTRKTTNRRKTFANKRITISKWRSPNPLVCVLLYFAFLSRSVICEQSYKITSKFNITFYNDVNEKRNEPEILEMGTFGKDGIRRVEGGQLVRVWTVDNRTDGCKDIVNAPQMKWIALVERGVCNINDKINMCLRYNASAVLIYSHIRDEKETGVINGVPNAVSVYMSWEEGRYLLDKLEKYKVVNVQISEGTQIPTGPDLDNQNPTNISKTSVLFVSISFIVLMIISLAWLVFYYIQRFRYAHAKERLTRRLASAAKKAIAKIPQRTIKSGDKELECEFDQCAVCIEGYKASDVIRILPCKHIFHKSCVDPWLLDQRSCPMCKLDILREYGMQVHLNSSQETVHAEPDSNDITGSGLADDVLSSPDEHASGRETMDILLIRHPSVHYHGSDTYTDIDETTERHALNPHPIECHTDIIEEIDGDSDSECTEMNSLMTGLPTKSSSHDIINILPQKSTEHDRASDA